jgi:hypothetical protein
MNWLNFIPFIVSLLLGFLGLGAYVRKIAKELKDVAKEGQEVFVAFQEFIAYAIAALADNKISNDELAKSLGKMKVIGKEGRDVLREIYDLISVLKHLPSKRG